MTARDEWGPWVEHDGKGCPCVGMWVQIIEVCAARGRLPVLEGRAGANGGDSWDWANHPICTKIIRYRIRRPRALIEMIDRAASIPQPERIDA